MRPPPTSVLTPNPSLRTPSSTTFSTYSLEQRFPPINGPRPHIFGQASIPCANTDSSGETAPAPAAPSPASPPARSLCPGRTTSVSAMRSPPRCHPAGIFCPIPMAPAAASYARHSPRSQIGSSVSWIRSPTPEVSASQRTLIRMPTPRCRSQRSSTPACSNASTRAPSAYPPPFARLCVESGLPTTTSPCAPKPPLLM